MGLEAEGGGFEKDMTNACIHYATALFSSSSFPPLQREDSAGGEERERDEDCAQKKTRATLQATQGQIYDLFIQFPYKYQQNRVASVGD